MPPKKIKRKAYTSTTTKPKKSGSKKGQKTHKETKATKAKISKGTAELGGEKITFKKGGLHRSLKVPTSYKFKTTELERINRIPDGKSFKFHDDTIKMSPRIHKQLTLGLNLMKRKS